jgi:hypothetical protein
MRKSADGALCTDIIRLPPGYQKEIVSSRTELQHYQTKA